MTAALSRAGRIVVKVGSALLVERTSGLRSGWLNSLVADIAAVMQAGKDVIIVSSGAIALGEQALDLQSKPKQLSTAQAAACIGQISLLNAYQEAFNQYDKKIGQLLLTVSDLDGRRTYLNARDALQTLIRNGIVPVINENDATATQEIRVGDNDRLAARVAQMIDADLLILLSDIDGVYTANPKTHADAQHIPIIESITPEVYAAAEGPQLDSMGSGGMRTKLDAGRILSDCGCDMIVMDGRGDAPLARLSSGERHSFFKTKRSDKIDARHAWIAGQLSIQGSIVVDDGAHQALLRGKSLLAAGITHLTGTFSRGDTVYIKTPS
ncbi:MAG: glutamate 5-kinase, partial [Pseudomonadota bacterium]